MPLIGSPTRARTWDLRINRPGRNWDHISNQALATHAKFQSLAKNLISEERSQALRTAIRELPEAKNVLALTQLLRY